MSRPVRWLVTLMPRSKRPEQMRAKAMRSRCAGSMLAWTLNTKAENGLSSSRGSSLRSSRGDGDGASSMTASSSRRTPKLVSADPDEHRRRLTGEERRQVDVGADRVEQRALVEGRLPGRAVIRAAFGTGRGDIGGLLGSGRCAAGRSGEPGVPTGAAIDQPVEVFAAADRPRDRRGAELDLLLRSRRAARVARAPAGRTC